jgi:predicted AAA+ superfamily ATPase
MFKRLAEVSIERELTRSSSNNVLIVEGARQVGKTTLIENLLVGRKNVIAINLEKELEFRLLLDQTAHFKDFEFLLARQYGFNREIEQILFIDEAQESEVLGRYVRFCKEEWPHTKTILTGSSMSRLFRAHDRVPVGRYTSFLITPLTFLEFLDFTNDRQGYDLIATAEHNPMQIEISEFMHLELLKTFDRYLAVGGLPNAVLAYHAGEDYQRQILNLYASQEEDFVRKTSLEDRTWFRMGLKGVANFLGNPAKNTHIHASHYTAEKILSLLKGWHLVYEIEQHGLAATTAFYPKRYIYDHGIAQFLRDMPFPPLSLVASKDPVLRGQLGGVIENIILSQLVSEVGALFNISGWRKDSQSGSEIDFVWRNERATIPIECKAALKMHDRNFSAVKFYLQQTQQSTGFVVSCAPFQKFPHQTLRLCNLPVYLATPTMITKLAR